ncbi:MAG: hypothetical protein H6706_09730 [Myxococcales bacterium]|nr:hypothetical protein [Myxococcales bacterium]
MPSYRAHLFVVLGVATNLIGCNSGWYSDEGLDEGLDAAPTDATRPDAAADAGADAADGAPDATDGEAALPRLDWEALAFCAPEGVPAGLRAWRGRPGPFQVDRA